MYRKGAPLPGFSTTVVSILSMTFMLTTLLSVGLLPAELVLFQPIAYLRALEQQDFYARFPNLLAVTLLEDTNTAIIPGLGNDAIEYLDQDDAALLFSNLMPDSWLRAQTETLVGNFGDLLNFKRTDLVLPLDLRELKTRLTGSQGEDAARRLVQSWPDCSAEDAARIAAQALSGELQGVPVCRPPDLLVPVFEGAVRVALSGFATVLPDQVDLAQPLTGKADNLGMRGPLAPGFWAIFRWYSWGRWLYRLTPVLAVSVLVWIILLTIRCLPDMFHALGQPLLQGGLLSTLGSGFMLLIGNGLLAGLVARSIPLLSGGFEVLLSESLHTVWSRASVWAIFLSLAIVVLAVIFLIAERGLSGPD